MEKRLASVNSHFKFPQGLGCITVGLTQIAWRLLSVALFSQSDLITEPYWVCTLAMEPFKYSYGV